MFLNNFECFDKKLHKNVIKRCGVEPLCQILNKDRFNFPDLEPELCQYLDKVIVAICAKGVCTDTLSERLGEALSQHADDLLMQPDAPQDQTSRLEFATVEVLKDFLDRASVLEFDLDYNKIQSIKQAF